LVFLAALYCELGYIKSKLWHFGYIKSKLWHLLLCNQIL